MRAGDGSGKKLRNPKLQTERESAEAAILRSNRKAASQHLYMLTKFDTSSDTPRHENLQLPMEIQAIRA